MSDSQSLNAEVYQALHTGTFGDWQFYKSLVKSKLRAKFEQNNPNGESLSVLELGCGSGRILGELSEFSIELYGLEIHEGLLGLCKQNLVNRRLDPTLTMHCNPELILGDFSELKACFKGHPSISAKQFDLIILPYNGLYCLLSEEAQTKLIREAVHLLSPQGELWFDGYALPDPDEYDYESSDDYSPLTVIDLAPSLLRKERVLGIEELDEFQQEKQRFTASYRFKAPDDEIDLEPLHACVEQVQHRYIYPWQLPKLCHNTGGQLQQVMADFGGQVIHAEQNIRSAIEWGIDAEHWVACVTKSL